MDTLRPDQSQYPISCVFGSLFCALGFWAKRFASSCGPGLVPPVVPRSVAHPGAALKALLYSGTCRQNYSTRFHSQPHHHFIHSKALCFLKILFIITFAGSGGKNKIKINKHTHLPQLECASRQGNHGPPDWLKRSLRGAGGLTYQRRRGKHVCSLDSLFSCVAGALSLHDRRFTPEDINNRPVELFSFFPCSHMVQRRSGKRQSCERAVPRPFRTRRVQITLFLKRKFVYPSFQESNFPKH